MNERPLTADADAVKTIAAALGFDDCRIAAVTGPAAHAAAYQEWVAAGEHGDMAYMAKSPSRRADPREVLHGVRAVVTVALRVLFVILVTPKIIRNFELGKTTNASPLSPAFRRLA